MAPLLPSNPGIRDPVSVLSFVTDAVGASPNSFDTRECHVDFIPREWLLTVNISTLRVLFQAAEECQDSSHGSQKARGVNTPGSRQPLMTHGNW